MRFWPTGLVATIGMALASSCGSSHPQCACSGQPCESDGDCDLGYCIADLDLSGEDLEPLPLACDCDDPGPDVGQPCQEASDCARGICLLAGTCTLPCVDDADCQSDQRCVDAYARTSDTALQPLGACILTASLPKGAEIESKVLEDLLPESNTVLLDPVKPTTLYVLEHLASDAWPAFERCRQPVCVDLLQTGDEEPVVLFDPELYAQQWEGDEKPPLNPVSVGTPMVANQSHPITIMLPNGPRSVLSDSGFEVEITTEKAGDLGLTKLFRDNPGTRLDLNLFYVGVEDWAPSGDRGPPLLEEALNAVERIYEPAGIRIGEVQQFEVVGGLREQFEIIDERYAVLEPLPRLFALSAGSRNPAVNLFFVRDIAGTVAISGGTPGPLGMHGTGGSGIAFSAETIGDADALGRVIAHEIGHYLGLFHTSEMGGYVLDPLPDTPECRIDQDQDGDGMTSAGECMGLGSDNLMFWSMSGGTEITEDQVEVMRSAAILY